MLIEFSVANYRSFRDEVTFSMVASPIKAGGAKLDERNQFPAPGDVNLLTSAAIYGANASGKSNLVAAINFMRRFVMTSSNISEVDEGIDVEPFRLSTETDTEPSFFEVVFIAEEQHYRYGFEVNAERVVAEWLHLVPTIRTPKLIEDDHDDIVLFKREWDDIIIGDEFEAEGLDLKNKTRSNVLFLSVVALFAGAIAQTVLKWFRTCNSLRGLSDRSLLPFTISQMRKGEASEKIEELVRSLDLGIDGIQLAIIQESTDFHPRQTGVIRIQRGEHAEDTEFERVSIHTIHRQYDDEGNIVGESLFTMDEHESQGTQKLFALSGPLLDTLEKGKVLFVDELDARLHPLLTREIVNLFNDPDWNTNHAQLIFVTQDTNLLSHQLLRRDQIWFTEKDHYGASHLYSLVEFKIDNDAPFERDYIQGRYGAIPFLGNIRQAILEDN
ncbi:MAG: ATP-binding protein [Caldilineaceae bacterium SB0661_bin_32]|uniref:ATP-binding protein n=1 Tax=Caldilineaceae bacterium SB0661_bin_32 TaxID=2605255 RepID=A0A6B1D987_9CHLR|nr:ATP-binding protein [Caldilineaceae bacterium SB0661_bin_32]